MPNYDYECQECGIRFEVFQGMNDPKLELCTTEGCSGAVKRLLGTGGGIIFKGSGFYKTDYRSSSYQAGAKAESSSSGGDGGGKSEGGGSKSGGESSGGSKPAPAPAAPAKSTD